MRVKWLCILLPFLLAQTRPAATDPAVQKQLQIINSKTANVKSLTADFEQRKFTAMLTEPLVSHGKLTVLGPIMLWKTTDPEPTEMRVDPKNIQIYYPNQKTVEIYAIEQKLATLAASPLPRLSVLEKYFTFRQMPATRPSTDEIALQLTPLGDLSQHVREVKVLLQTSTGLLVRMELLDADEDDTVIDFSHIRTDVAVDDKDVELNLPRDVKVTHPLAGLESGGS